jgi:hypothetical protein
MSQPSYTEHLDALVALVTNLAMTEWKSRTPTILAKELALDYDEVVYVLDRFKGLFRKSYGRKEYEDRQEPFYWLQLRWARRYVEEATEDDVALKEPLEADYLSTLLDFILTMVEQEQAAERQQMANRTALYSSWLAAVVVVLGVIANILVSLAVR